MEMQDEIDKMIAFNKEHTPQEQVCMLLMMAGRYEEMAAAAFADSEALDTLFCDVFGTAEFDKLIHYLQS